MKMYLSISKDVLYIVLPLSRWKVAMRDLHGENPDKQRSLRAYSERVMDE